jgi:hypothetical protein
MEAIIDTLSKDNSKDIGIPVASVSTKLNTTIEQVGGPIHNATSTTAGVDMKTTIPTLANARIVGNRWAIASSCTNLSGDWILIVTDDFRTQYDNYLVGLGQPRLVRSVALNIIAQTTEKIIQTDNGRSLQIVGRNIRGTWSRTLVASGTDLDHDEFIPFQISITSADSESVEAESWWEQNGTVHVSWMRGVTKYGGGSFESRRYLEDDAQIYACESVFHPRDTSKQSNMITWRFRRQAASR